MNKRPSFLILTVLYLLVAYLPFQLALNLSPDIDLMSGRIFISALFLAWLVLESREKKEKPGVLIRGPVYLALILFFILSGISIFAAQNQFWGMRKLLVFISVFPLFFLVRVLVKKEEHAKMIIYMMIGGAAVSAVIALAQFLAQFIFGLNAVMDFWAARVVPLFSGASFGAVVAANPSWLVNIGGQTVMRAIGFFPDPHMLSFYLGLTSSFALAALFFEKRFRILLFIANCLLLTVLLLTFSRGGYLGLLSSLSVFIFLSWQKLGNKDKKFFSACFLLLLVILLLAGWPVAARLISSFDVQEGSNMGRLAIWQDSWQIIKKSPFIGVGLGNYPLAVDFSGNYRSAVTSHNLYLDIWAESGIFGLLVWLGLLFSAAKAAYKKLEECPVVALACLSALAYFFAHSFFETAIFNPTILSFLMVVLALASDNLKEDVL